MYATKQDMIDRFGENEIIQLTDRLTAQGNVVFDTLLDAKLDDACAELNVILSCCYDLRTIKAVYDSGNFIAILKHWQCDITRKHLYDSLVNQNNQVNYEYKDYEQEIKKVCECADLYDNEFNLVPKKGFFTFNEDPGCYPPSPCCPTDPCGCKDWTDD